MSEIHSWLYLRLCTVLFYRLNLITSKFPLQAFLFLWFSKQHSYCSHYFARNRILLLFYFIFNPHLKICLLIWERERERGKERNINFASCMCPDWESNWRHCGLQASAQSTESHQPGLFCAFKKVVYLLLSF